MKLTVFQCDICSEPIAPTEEPVVIKPDEGSQKKQIGCDIVLTPRGNRLHCLDGKAMVRVNASFYCGSHPDNLDELHFHQSCIEKEVVRRVLHFYRGERDG